MMVVLNEVVFVVVLYQYVTGMQLHIKNLNYSYKSNNQFCLGPVNIRAKDKLLVFGKNGSGKTSFLKCVAGILKPKVEVLHLNKKNFSVFWLGAEAAIYWESLSGYEYLELQNSLYGQSKKTLPSKFEQLKKMPLDISFLHQNIFSMSKGQKKLLGLWAGLMSPASMVILDEPDANLDSENKDYFYQLLFHHSWVKNKFILFSSHQHSLPISTHEVSTLNLGGS